MYNLGFVVDCEYFLILHGTSKNPYHGDPYKDSYMVPFRASIFFQGVLKSSTQELLSAPPNEYRVVQEIIRTLLADRK